MNHSCFWLFSHSEVCHNNFLCCDNIFLGFHENFFIIAIFFSIVRIFIYFENFCGVARVFLMLWEFLFCCKNFYGVIRFSHLLREFFFHWENFSPENSFVCWENFSPQSKNFLQIIQKGSDRLCSLCLVLWVRPFYSPEYKDEDSLEKG